MFLSGSQGPTDYIGTIIIYRLIIFILLITNIFVIFLDVGFVDSFILSPRLVPYYYPMPYVDHNHQSVGSIGSTIGLANNEITNSNQYSSNSYNGVQQQLNQQHWNYPHDGSFIPGRGGVFSALFQKPFLRWKLSKFG